MPAYQEQFPKGSEVRVVDLEHLRAFQRPTWKYHHPIQEEQLRFAGRGARVQEVQFYHGGDVLYVLEGVPGIWHEAGLTEVGDRPSRATSG